MSMEKHKCKLCSRKFLNGKALGGHMRSHLMALPLPPKTPPENQDSGGRSESTLSLCSSENQEDEEEEEEGVIKTLPLSYGLRENPKKSFKMVDPEFLDAESVVQDRESETESTRNTTRKRSKRSRRMVLGTEKLFEPVVSSFSDTTSTDEDIAMCLMMLSSDVWKSSDDSKFRPKKQSKFQCEICNRVFKSSQALGSHKTIHKNKNKNKNKNYNNMTTNSSTCESHEKTSRNVEKKVHECPFCGKMFGSGQALGGHKRSHFLSSSTTTASSSSRLGDHNSFIDSNSAKFPNGFIDLNMPPPMEDEQDFN